MAKFSNIQLTQHGLDMMINADNTKKVIYTKIGLGDGILTESENVKALNALKHEIIKSNISHIQNDSASQITLETVITNNSIDDAFYARELGVFAKLGEDGEEILYAYANAKDTCDYIPDKSQPVDELKLKITLVVGNVKNVTVEINPSIVFTTLEDCRREIQEHNISVAAHDNLARKDDVYTKIETDNFLNMWHSSKTYKLGDIAYHKALPSWARLECVQAGTTAATLQDLSGVHLGDKMTDGTVIWQVTKPVSMNGGTEAETQPSTVGWVKSKFQDLLKNALNLSGVRWDLDNPVGSGYIYFGKLFGGLVIEFVYFNTNNSDNNNEQEKALPLALNKLFYGNLNVFSTEHTISPVVYAGLTPDKGRVRVKFNVGREKSSPVYGIIIGTI